MTACGRAWSRPVPSFDNSWSRAVFWLKIALPVLALAVLSMLFLLARSVDPDRFLPYSKVEVEELAREQRMGGAEVTGVTSDGAAVVVRADVARPGFGVSPATADNVTATYTANDGFRADISADAGKFEDGADLLTLDGNVRVQTSDGITVTSEQMIADMEATRVTSPVATTVVAPYGRIDAGNMVLDRAGGQGTEVLVFKGGVRLVYEPESGQTEAPNDGTTE